MFVPTSAQPRPEAHLRHRAHGRGLPGRHRPTLGVASPRVIEAQQYVDHLTLRYRPSSVDAYRNPS